MSKSIHLYPPLSTFKKGGAKSYPPLKKVVSEAESQILSTFRKGYPKGRS